MSYQSIIEYPSDGVTKNYVVPFPYVSTDHIFAYDMGEGVGEDAPRVVNIDHWNGPSEVVLENTLPTDHILRIQRITPAARMAVEYTDSSFPTEYQLNLANTQLLFLIQEQQDAAQAGSFIALVDHRSLSGLLEANQHNINTTIGLQAALDQKAPAESTNTRITALETQSSTNAGLIAQKADKSYVDTQLAGKAAASHSHAQADVEGLTTALQQIGITLNSKAPNTLASASNSGLMSADMWSKVNGWTPVEVPIATTTTLGIVKPDGGTITIDPDGTLHTTTGGVGVTIHSALTGRDAPDCHPLAAITGLQAALADKASAVHAHSVSEVTGLSEQLASKVNTSTLNGYVTTAVFDTAVSAKADTAFVTGALAEKAALTHTHSQGDVTGLATSLAGKADLTSPALTGTPTAPTAPAETATAQIATTEFVHAVAGSGGVTVHNELTGRDASDSHPIEAVSGLAAALANPALSLATRRSYSEEWTGRYDAEGRKIYAKTINTGALPNNTTKNISHGVVNVFYVEKVGGRTTNGANMRNLPSTASSSAFVDVYGTVTSIAITTVSAWAGYNQSEVDIEYTCTDR